MRALQGLVAVAMAVAACSKARPVQGDLGQPVSWQEDIGPLMAADCNSCHSGAAAAAGYRTTSYLEALGPVDAPVVTEGDASSLLLRTIDPAQADAVHQKVSAAFASVRAWAVDGRLSYRRGGVHEAGVLNPNDPSQFHGDVLHGADWKFGICQDCHGDDFRGGNTGVSCFQCHAQGPTSCDTCHGQPPATGAHAAHALGTLGHPFDCSECHIKPLHFDDPGHLTTANGKAKEKATITFGAQAALGSTGRGGPPTFDGVTCSNIYCHGVTLQDSKATSTQPIWNGGTAACGSCHGLPPASHDVSSTNCSECHHLVTPPPGKGPITALHANGVVDVGDGSGTCSACHGSPQSIAPPRDLEGNTSTTALGVGAHQAHLGAQNNLSAPIACSDCHQVPAAVHSPGHIDHPLPAIVTFSGLAVSDGARPVWDRNTASCTNTYCHGGGTDLAADTGAALRAPVWTFGTSQAFCGSCHGVPPTTPVHAGIAFPDCARCHASTIAPNGAILVTGPPGARTSTHINGVVDVTP
jgi:predicted CxxxxCH...CXXCH cytochrome family protein